MSAAICRGFFWSESSEAGGWVAFLKRRGGEFCPRIERHAENRGLVAGGQRAGHPLGDGRGSGGDGNRWLVERAEGGGDDVEQNHEIKFGTGLQRESRDRHFGDNSELSWLASEHDTR